MQEFQSRILIVERNAGNTEYIEALLEEGYLIVKSKDGLDALAKFKSNSFDLVIIEIMLPSMDGIELMEKMKQLIPKMPIIVNSFHANKDLIDEIKRMGACQHILKPFESGQMLKVVQRVLH